MKFQLLSENCLLVTISDQISEEVLRKVISLEDRIVNANLPGVNEIVPAYASLAIYFDPLLLPYQKLHIEMSALLSSNYSSSIRHDTRLWEVPVCYDREYGVDLEELSQNKGLSIDELIERHTQVTYTVYMLGFLPGFVYLGILDPILRTERRKQPRDRVAAGSVAIGGEQTGLYGIQSPGGWHIIGRTPTTIFDIKKKPINPFRQGDKVKFNPISKSQFTSLLQK